jgi:hypothetical protein
MIFLLQVQQCTYSRRQHGEESIQKIPLLRLVLLVLASLQLMMTSVQWRTQVHWFISLQIQKQ